MIQCTIKVIKKKNQQKDYLSRLNLTMMEEKESFSKKQRFRDLFKKRKSTLIVGALILCLIVFGISKSFILITGVIVFNSFAVIFWSSFGKQLMDMFKFKKKEK